MSKVLTIRQPYIQALLEGVKLYETRTWHTNYRGKMFLHAATARPDKKLLDLAKKYNIAPSSYGKIIAECVLEDCVKMDNSMIDTISTAERDFGHWETGNYACKLSDVKILPEPNLYWIT